MKLKLYSLFTSNMVLQQQEPICFRGWAAAGGTVAVQLAGESTRTTVAADGSWSATLAPLRAGGPHEVIFVCGEDRIVLSNVMIGEVWVCSGQSNMDWPLGTTVDGARFVAESDRPLIRLLKLRRIPHPDVPESIDAQWKVCRPESAADFSALAYHFGVELQPALGVPIGLIDAARGGSIIEAWTPRSVLQSDAEFGPLIEAYEESLPRHAELMAEHQKTMQMWNQNMPPADPGNTKFAAGWASPALDDSAWPGMNIPCWWQRGNQDFSGVLWFRKEIQVPEECAGRDLTLRLGACDKSDTTYFNNVEVGGIPPHVEDCWRTPRIYTIPGHLVRARRNVLTVRVFSNINQAGLTGPASAMILETAGWSVPLAGLWRFQVEHNFGQVRMPAEPWGPGVFDSPYILFNSLIAPLTCFRIAGSIWWQGSANETNPDRYRRLFPAMIRGWRQAWKQEFPFLFVQQPNFGPETPKQTLWAELRDAQAAALAEPLTAMVPTIDIGDPNDLHPANKVEVGHRLCLAALSLAYGWQDPALLAPTLKSVSARGHELWVSVMHSAGGLCIKGDRALGFEIAGSDGNFVTANARIANSDIVVWNECITAPVAVRYAWADNPRCNVFNSAGLPLAPFRAQTAGMGYTLEP